MAFSHFRIALAQPAEVASPLSAAHPSLAYLQPKKQTRCRVYGNSDAASDNPHHHPTETFLCETTTDILDILCNVKDYDHPTLARYLPPDFDADKDNDGQLMAPAGGQLGRIAKTAKRMPNFGAEILSSVARVHESGRGAEVWTWLRMRGLPVSDTKVKFEGGVVEGEGIVKECVSVLRWDKSNEGWKCVSVKVMRGVSGI